MGSGVFDSILLRDLWSTQEMREIFSDETRVQKWFDVEVAIAREQARLGIIPAEAAEEIASKADVRNVDLAELARQAAITKHGLVPALRELQKLCTPPLGEWLHFGPTTQDILDTGVVLQVKEAHAIVLRDLRAVGREVYRLAETHRDTPMVGRTHGVQALPITFGHKCAIWLRELSRHHDRLKEAEARVFVGGAVGAVGTMASYGEHALELEAGVMARLGLASADISWQPARDRMAEYVGVLGLIGGTLAKIANEIYVLQHNEIDELQEPFSEGKVGSSTMPHKRNPTVVESIVTVGRALRYDVAMMAEAMVQQHERDGVPWKTEWKALPESCMMIGFMLARSKVVLAGLVVNAAKMRANLDVMGGFLLSERVMFFLGERLGKQTAHEVVYEASMRGQERGLTLEAVLLDDPKVRELVDPAALREILDPTTYTGLASQIVDRALAATNAEHWLDA